MARMQLDVVLFRWMNEHHNPVLDGIMGAVSAVGEASVGWLLVCALMFFFGRGERKQAAVVLLLAMLMLDGLVGGAIKAIWPRPRPYEILTGVNRWGIAWGGQSFPSGHAYSGTLAAVILGARFRRSRYPLAAFAAVTCYSRPYFGMHYPSDVLAGAVLGIIAGLLTLRIEKAWERKKESAEPAWWSEPHPWSLIFSAIGAGAVAGRVFGFKIAPLALMGLGLVLGLASLWGKGRAGKWVGAAGAALALLTLAAALFGWFRLPT